MSTSSSSSSNGGGVHVLVFPYPAQGHMLPLLDLTHQLSLRGIAITILITPKNLPTLTPLLASSPSIQTLILPFPDHPSIPPGVENVKDIGNHGNIPIISALSLLRDPIIQWFRAHPNPPVALLSDFFLGWTHRLAEDLGIPRVVFYSSGAFVVAIFDHLWTNYDSIEPGVDVKLHDLPSMPIFPWDQVFSLFRLCKGLESKTAEFVKTSMAENTLSWGSVFNSFWTLEDRFFEFLSSKMGHPRLYSVGPLNLVDGSGQLRAGGGSTSESNLDYGVVSWLDGCHSRSVLYVCFGSQKVLNAAQTEALATALESSGVRFVWVVKSVPVGFEDRVAGRGLVIKGWAPQTAILSHRAVGGFLSHCGWNSTLEAITAGVMILAWPMEADQFADAKLLAEYVDAAVLVCEGADTVPDSAKLARIISESMDGCATQRAKAKDLRKQALEAVEAGGSSIKDLDSLAQQLSQLNNNWRRSLDRWSCRRRLNHGRQ